MFLSNKYTTWYFQIVEVAKRRENLQEYHEKHHIVPKSLGGANRKENLVRLTAREHFICHQLLVRMTTGKDRSKMSWALWRLSNINQNLTAKQYAVLRERISHQMRDLMIGRKVSQETRARQSASKKRTHNTPEYKAALSERAKNYSSEHRAKIGAAHRGKTISPEMREKQSAALSGEKNPRAMDWVVEFEDGRPSIKVTSLKTWCQENDIKYTSIYMRIKRGDTSFLNGVRVRHITDARYSRHMSSQYSSASV